MTSLIRGLPTRQVLGDIEIAQTMKKDQQEAESQQQDEVRKSNTLTLGYYVSLINTYLINAQILNP